MYKLIYAHQVFADRFCRDPGPGQRTQSGIGALSGGERMVYSNKHKNMLI